MPYHHGRLRDALVEAGLALARPHGPDDVVLRAASRLAGVSHNAAYNHFADRDSLLRAVAEQCMGRLAVLMETRAADLPAPQDPTAGAWDRLYATGRAYLEFALGEPGWFRTAFAVPRGVGDFGPGEGVGSGGLNPYQLLGAALDALVEVGALSPHRRSGAEYAAWSAVHGLATLLLDGPLRDLPVSERHHAMQRVLDVVAAGL